MCHGCGRALYTVNTQVQKWNFGRYEGMMMKAKLRTMTKQKRNENETETTKERKRRRKKKFVFLSSVSYHGARRHPTRN